MNKNITKAVIVASVVTSELLQSRFEWIITPSSFSSKSTGLLSQSETVANTLHILHTYRYTCRYDSDLCSREF